MLRELRSNTGRQLSRGRRNVASIQLLILNALEDCTLQQRQVQRTGNRLLLQFWMLAVACPISGFAKGWFPMEWFCQMFPCTKMSSKEALWQRAFPCSATLAAESYEFLFLEPPNQNKGTFDKTTLSQNRPFVSSRVSTRDHLPCELSND